nr:NADH dehydrogenase subunit 4L [Nogodinidae sp.]
MFFCLFMFFSGVFGLVIVRKHYLLSLLSLEFLVLSLFSFCYFYLSFYIFEYFFSVIFLVLGVCEGVLGLSLIVYLFRSGSFEYLDSLSLY